VDKGSAFRIYKEFSRILYNNSVILNNKKTSNSIKTGKRFGNFTKGDDMDGI
jgi:hypothetical protein